MRKHVFPILEHSFRDNTPFDTDTGTHITYLRKFSEHLIGQPSASTINFIVGINKNDSSGTFFESTPSRVDGVIPQEIEIPPGFVVCIGSKGHSFSSYEGKNPVTFPGHPSDAFSIPGTSYSTSGVLNRSVIGVGEGVTIMWTGTRWVWMGSNNWV